MKHEKDEGKVEEFRLPQNQVFQSCFDPLEEGRKITELKSLGTKPNSKCLWGDQRHIIEYDNGLLQISEISALRYFNFTVFIGMTKNKAFPAAEKIFADSHVPVIWLNDQVSYHMTRIEAEKKDINIYAKSFPFIK